MAHVGSLAKRSSNAFSAALHQNECSIATARSKSPCSFGSQEVANLTVPSLPRPDSSPSWANVAEVAKAMHDASASSACFFMGFPLGPEQASLPHVARPPPAH